MIEFTKRYRIQWPFGDCGGFWQLFSGFPKRDFPNFESFSKHPILTPPDFFGVEIGEPTLNDDQ